jgi:hypothetical protein
VDARVQITGDHHRDLGGLARLRRQVGRVGVVDLRGGQQDFGELGERHR